MDDQMNVAQLEEYIKMMRRNKVHKFHLRLAGGEFSGELTPDEELPPALPERRVLRRGADGLTASEQIATYGRVMDAEVA